MARFFGASLGSNPRPTRLKCLDPNLILFQLALYLTGACFGAVSDLTVSLTPSSPHVVYCVFSANTYYLKGMVEPYNSAVISYISEQQSHSLSKRSQKIPSGSYSCLVTHFRTTKSLEAL
jgi:hypothetical protein